MILQGVWRDDPRLVPTSDGVRTVQVRTREWVCSSNPLGTSAPLFAQCGHENFAWLEIRADDGDYQGKILALGKAWLEARELLVVIHHKSLLLVAFYGMAIAGSYQPQVNSLGIRPDETQVDTATYYPFPLGSSATGLFWTDSVQRGALNMNVRVSI